MHQMTTIEHAEKGKLELIETVDGSYFILVPPPTSLSPRLNHVGYR